MNSTKNWLIRTTQKQILGPISKEKVLEFVHKNSLKPEDEVSSGNGYWFKVKESDLLEKYIHGDIPQGFNPIEEAPVVLSRSANQEKTATINPGAPKASTPPPIEIGSSGDINLPSNEDLSLPDVNDLEYPDVDIPVSASTTNEPPPQEVIESSIEPGFSNSNEDSDEEFNDDLKDGIVPSAIDLEYPDVSVSDIASEFSDLKEKDENFTAETQVEEAENASKDVKKSDKKERRKKKQRRSNTATNTHVLELDSIKGKKTSRNDQFLYMILAVALGVIVWTGFKYYQSNFVTAFNKRLQLITLSMDAHAQALVKIKEQKKKDKLAESLKVSELSLKLNFSENGHELQLLNIEGIGKWKCSGLSDFHLELAYVLVKTNEQKKAIEKQRLLCGIKGTPSFELLKTLSNIQINSLAQLKAILKSQNISSQIKNKIIKKYKLLEARRSENLVSLFKDIIVKKDDLKLNSYKYFTKALEAIDSTNPVVLGEFLKAFIYSYTGNQGRAKKLIKGFLGADLMYKSHEFDSLIIKKEDIAYLKENISFFLNLIKVNTADTSLAKILQRYISSYISMGSNIDRFSLVDARELLLSHNYGLSLPSFWFSEVAGRISHQELKVYFDSVSKNDYLKEISPWHYWLLGDLNLPMSDTKEIVSKSITRRNLSWDNEVSKIYLLNYSEIRKILFGKKIATFQAQRVIFNKTLDGGDLITYSFFQLLKMGEYNSDHLWWFVL